MPTCAQQAKDKLVEIIQRLELAILILLAEEAIATAAGCGGLFLPPIRRREGVDHPEEAESVEELHAWAEAGIPICEAWSEQ